MEKKVYVGSYTGPEKGKGIYYCLLDTETGALRRISVEEQCENPNFIAVNWKKKILCALNESDKGIWLSSYEIQDDGFLCYLDQKDISGRGPCHICMDSDARRVFFANYISGDVGMVLLDETGHFEEEEYITSHSGKSVHARQTEPHPHGVHLSPDEDYLFVPDLGTDEVVMYVIEKDQLRKRMSKKVLPGDGPRHLVFHPNGKWVYLICEITNVVYVYLYSEENGLEEIQRISLLSKDMKNEYIAGEIAVTSNGKYLLAGTRTWGAAKEKQGFLTIFEIDKNGLLVLKKVVESGGCHPRMFSITSDGSYVLIANQYSGDVISFRFSQETGEIKKSDKCAIPEATCVWCE